MAHQDASCSSVEPTLTAGNRDLMYAIEPCPCIEFERAPIRNGYPRTNSSLISLEGFFNRPSLLPAPGETAHTAQ
jgi:hypothetical protein